MPVKKNITVQIYNRDINVSVLAFQSVTVETEAFPPDHVGRLMSAVTGFTLDEEDHAHLNNLHTHGKCAFRFGKDWEFFVEASVAYPENN